MLSGENRTLSLCSFDHAGENYKYLYSSPEYVEALSHTAGYVVFLDHRPDEDNSLASQLRYLYNVIIETRQLKISFFKKPFYLVLTKFDKHKGKYFQFKEKVNDIFAIPLNFLKQTNAIIRFLGLSSVGNRTQKGKIQEPWWVIDENEEHLSYGYLLEMIAKDILSNKDFKIPTARR